MFVWGLDNMHKILAAALDICHAKVARSLKAVNTDEFFIVPSTLTTNGVNEWNLRRQRKFLLAVAALEAEDYLERWEELETQKKIRVASLYSRVLDAASELWDNLAHFGFTHGSKKHAKPVRKFSNIAKGLGLLRRLPRITNFEFYWPQDSFEGDDFIC
jgi:hypothetical protein